MDWSFKPPHIGKKLMSLERLVKKIFSEPDDILCCSPRNSELRVVSIARSATIFRLVASYDKWSSTADCAAVTPRVVSASGRKIVRSVSVFGDFSVTTPVPSSLAHILKSLIYLISKHELLLIVRQTFELIIKQEGTSWLIPLSIV